MTGATAKQADPDYQGPERRQRPDTVLRSEFCEFREKLDRRMDIQDERLATGAEVMAKLNTAMFAETSDNEFGSPGVMRVMQKINLHVDMMCNFASFIRKVGNLVKWVGGIVIVLGGAVTAARALGWWS